MTNIIKKWDKLPVTGVVAVVAFFIGAFGFASNGPLVGTAHCEHPLRHVYNAQRLQVLASCQQIHFKVVAWRHEHDNDYHVDGVVAGGGWTNPANVRGQHGYTVIEFVPGDPRPKKFFAGQELDLTVTKVYDQQHKLKTEKYGWIEGHPVFAEKDVTPESTVPHQNRPNLVTREDDK